MLKTLSIAVLVITLVGAVGVAVLDAQSSAASATPTPVSIAQAPTATATVEPATPTLETAGTLAAPVVQAAGTPVQLQQFVDNVGEPWTGSGTIVELDAAGLNLALTDGTEIYVELGPTAYWQGQGVTLNPGDVVTIDGFFNGDQYHTAILTTASGAQIIMRNETGQPLWSGGQNNTGGQNGNGANQEVLIPAEDWETVEGTVTTASQNMLTMQTTSGEVYSLQLGQPTFQQSQAVTFAAGDAITVQGFWQDGQFQAAQITKTATGERLLLRDPNGRPLWGGPGRNGNSNGNGNGSTSSTGAVTTASAGGQGNQGNGGQGQGNQGNQGGGQGSQGQGGQGNQGAGNQGQGGQGQGGNSQGRQWRGGRTS